MVQGFLRHESIATTMRYIEPDPSRQPAAMRALADALPWGARENTTAELSRTPPSPPPIRSRIGLSMNKRQLSTEKGR
jgi:hypothetical protein